ncbi:NADH dehydrogenase (ubiquinone) 1 beta subcomplex subunit 9 [Marchantia polymorpha subsp. ruderalis]|uniref:NADH dehydrogenase [ubiquinone] 1 beta subcomplex subunit 9 n=2 Tax=Marchantia polymorpha TaxID=3197 RepID=A0AAF6AUN0_MARPO|nr:hypothetical protein MARPO_0002s0197 [Marchantia polymorpha]BBN00151.1 hypothetical protein Mp_1g26810 [Marchantia polymorpha subsp. ruderalis]|eukprot:PTQ49733.1 hypothetical protein MARPO_0002s0197 [Marchantia polymorpha]
MSSAANAAKRALQQERTRLLYRRSLKQILSWAVHREIFYVEASKTRAAFEANRNVEDISRIDRLIGEGEAKLEKMRHPDPYTVPWAPGGSKYARSPPVPEEIGLVYDFGRQEEWDK